MVLWTMEKKINLQKRDYTSKEKTYTQYRINIPLEFVRRLGWDNEDEPQQLQMKFKKSKDRKFLQIQVED